MKPKRKKTMRMKDGKPYKPVPPPAPKGNQRAAGSPGGGRKTQYRSIFCVSARKLTSRGGTIAELAEAFDVSSETIQNWREAHPDFSLSIEKGREDMVDNVERALYERAIGYRHNDVDIRTVSEGQGMGSHIVQTPITKHYPPEVGAATFLLKNLRNAKWRDRIEQTLANPDGSAIAPITVTVVGAVPPAARHQTPESAAGDVPE